LVLISFREWLHSYTGKALLKGLKKAVVLISFREWLHSYDRHRPLSCNRSNKFSSLSESGFIPTGIKLLLVAGLFSSSSHLFQRVASFLLAWIPERSRKPVNQFSSLSESGFIPTNMFVLKGGDIE